MSDLVNKRMVLVKRPQGMPEASCWKLVEGEAVPELSPSHALVEVLYLSIDPAMRAWLDEDCHVPPVAIGETMRALGVGRVLNSSVIGIAGGAHKVRHVIDELGFDDCIDYKAEDVHASLGEKAPDGVDVYFDNVGGDILLLQL